MNPLQDLQASLDELLALQPTEVREAAQNILGLHNFTQNPVYGIILRRPRSFIAFVLAQLRLDGQQLAPSELDPTADNAAELGEAFEELYQLIEVILTRNGVNDEPRFRFLLPPPDDSNVAEIAGADPTLLEAAQDDLTARYESSKRLFYTADEDAGTTNAPDIYQLFRVAFSMRRPLEASVRALFEQWEADEMHVRSETFVRFANMLLCLAEQASPGFYERIVSGSILPVNPSRPAPQFARAALASRAFLFFAMAQLTGVDTPIFTPVIPVPLYQTVRSELAQIITSGDMLGEFGELLSRFRYIPSDFAMTDHLRRMDEATLDRFQDQMAFVQRLTESQQAQDLDSVTGPLTQWNCTQFERWLGANSTLDQEDRLLMEMLNDMDKRQHDLDLMCIDLEEVLDLARVCEALAMELQEQEEEEMRMRSNNRTMSVSQQVDTDMLLADPYAQRRPSMALTTGWVPPVRSGDEPGDAAEDDGIGEDCVICSNPLGGRYGEPPYQMPCCNSLVGLVCLRNWIAQAQQPIPELAGKPMVPNEPTCPICRQAVVGDLSEQPMEKHPDDSSHDGTNEQQDDVSLSQYGTDVQQNEAPEPQDEAPEPQDEAPEPQGEAPEPQAGCLCIDWFDNVFVPQVFVQFTQKYRAREANMPWFGHVFPAIDASAPGPSGGPTNRESEALREWLVMQVRPRFEERLRTMRAQ